MAVLLHQPSFMTLFRTIATAVALFAIASLADAAPITFLLDDGEGAAGITVSNNSAVVRFETQTGVRQDQYAGLPDADGDGVADPFDEDPSDATLNYEIFDLIFLHTADPNGAFSSALGWGEFGSVASWMFVLPDFPVSLSSFANPLDSAGRLGTTDDLWAESFFFISDDCACDPNPWLALGGATGFFGGLFQTSDATFHQFWVELMVDVADGTLTLLSAGYESDVYQAVDDPDLEEVPEPATVSLFALGTAGLVVLHRRRRR